MLDFFKKKDSSGEGSTSKNWYKDRYQYVLVWRNIFALTTLVALLVSLASVFAVKALAPLKTVEPFVIQVDQKSGIPEVVDPLTQRELAVNEALSRYFVGQYIRAREGYDPIDVRQNYEVVRVMSEPDTIYAEFLEATSRFNSKSPISRLKTEGRIEVKFKTISFIDSQTVQARIQTREAMFGQVQTKNYTVLVRFEYANIQLNAQERLLNPIGFRVTAYRLDEDV